MNPYDEPSTSGLQLPSSDNEVMPSTSTSGDEDMQISSSEESSDNDNDDNNDESDDFERIRTKKARLCAVQQQDVFEELENAFRGNLKTFFLKNSSSEIKDISLFLSFHKDALKQLLFQQLNEFNSFKFNILLETSYEKPNFDVIQDRAFKTKNHIVLTSTDVDDLLTKLYERLYRESVEYEGQGSGWTLKSVDGILVRINWYQPLRGATFIPLPKVIADKHAVINLQNSDEKCFQWSVLCHYVTGRNRYRINNRYRQLLNGNLVKFEGITFPTPLKDIDKFEKNNPNISVNVYSLDQNNIVFPLRVTKEEKHDHLDLLVITNSLGVSHYCYISNLSRLVNSNIHNHQKSSVFCKMCLTHYYGRKKHQNLKEHKTICKGNRPHTRIIMPDSHSDHKILKFTKYQNTLRLPIVVYADFESILKPDGKKQSDKSKHTYIKDTHVPMSFGVYTVCSKDLPASIREELPQEPFIYRDVDCASVFMDYVTDLVNKIGDLVNKNIQMLPLTSEENSRVKNTTNCEMCNRLFTSTWTKQRDHCHLTGKFRSVLCQPCNLSRQTQKFIPVFIHGSSNYDSHFIVRQLGFDERPINIIPNSTEKYISFSKQTQSGLKIRFLDTFKFMNKSLDELVNNLPDSKFNNIKKFFSSNDLPLVTKKGIYPYEYTTSWDKLEETELPPKSAFKNSLKSLNIDEAYQHALKVWSHFKIETLGSYSDLYLKLDVLLLSDVFENFRDLCLESYYLDCAHYYTLPGFTFDCMLKYTGVELELLTDYDMFMFIEKGIRGGITTCVKRHCVANNIRMGEQFDNSKPNTNIIYVDCNNLYGWAMVNQIPLRGFEWYKGNLDHFDIMAIPEKSKVGFFLEVDVDYPEHLHDDHNDLPFLPVNKCPPGSKQKKLLTTLTPKLNYVCHYLILQQAIQNGLVLKKVHRVLKFEQECWLKPYIDLNTIKRQQAKNSFEVELYKNMNNSLFGKTIENQRKRMHLELISSDKRLKRVLSKPTFQDRIIYDETLCAVQCAKEKIVLDKPIYIGFTVLELSKSKMYDFHYKTMKPKYGSKLNVLYMDTDAFFYEIETEDFYHDLINDKAFFTNFDTSDYSKVHPCFSLVNKKVLGKFKDEVNGDIILEFIGLRPKLYSYKTLKSTKKKAKGITKDVIENNISFEDYKNCLFNDQIIRKKISYIRSRKHIIETITCNKVALSAKDDKRVIQDNGVNTLAHGHYKVLNKIKNVFEKL